MYRYLPVCRSLHMLCSKNCTDIIHRNVNSLPAEPPNVLPSSNLEGYIFVLFVRFYVCMSVCVSWCTSLFVYRVFVYLQVCLLTTMRKQTRTDYFRIVRTRHRKNGDVLDHHLDGDFFLVYCQHFGKHLNGFCILFNCQDKSDMARGTTGIIDGRGADHSATDKVLLCSWTFVRRRYGFSGCLFLWYLHIDGQSKYQIITRLIEVNQSHSKYTVLDKMLSI